MNVEYLKKYKDGLYASLSRDLDNFEKNFILIATGILAFSVTFIKEIVKINEAIYLPALFIAWTLIVKAIGLMMFTFLKSVNAGNELWKKVDDFLVHNKKFDNAQTLTESEALKIKEETNRIFFRRKRQLKNLRFWAIWSFLLGVMFFSFFVGINIYRENQKDISVKILNKNKNILIIKAGKTETTTNDSLIIINH